MGDSSDSDAEEDSKLREALDSETMTDNLYSKVIWHLELLGEGQSGLGMAMRQFLVMRYHSAS